MQWQVDLWEVLQVYFVEVGRIVLQVILFTGLQHCQMLQHAAIRAADARVYGGKETCERPRETEQLNQRK